MDHPSHFLTWFQLTSVCFQNSRECWKEAFLEHWGH
jgi:hypothetical protein